MADLHSPRPAEPGRPLRQDSTDQRTDTRNLFIHREWQPGWRHIEVTERRTIQDFAPHMKGLVGERSPHAATLRVSLENLNTHGPGSLDEAFAPAEARRVVEKLGFHYPPTHGSGVNMAAIELSILQRQCVARRGAEEAALRREVAAREAPRNQEQARIDWRFAIPEAREKLPRLDPSPLVR